MLDKKHTRRPTSRLSGLNIVLIGPAGSGKGTIAHLLSEKTSLIHVSMGDLLRKEAKKKTKLAKEIKKCVDTGKLASDEIAFSILKKTITHKGYIFDGFPRSLHQAKIFHEKYPVDMIIVLTVPKKELLRRLLNRRMGKDGKIYNLVTLKHAPSKDMLMKRNDDNLNVINKRLQRYKERSKAVINYFKKHDKVVKIDANRSPKEILKDVLAVLKKL